LQFLAVPHRPQRSVFAAPKEPAGGRAGPGARNRDGPAIQRADVPGGVVAGGGRSAETPVRGPGRRRGFEGVPGFQVRGNGGNPGVPGVDGEIASLYGSRSAEGDVGAGVGGTIMSCLEFDWKAFVLDEVPRAEMAAYRQHASSCDA